MRKEWLVPVGEMECGGGSLLQSNALRIHEKDNGAIAIVDK